MKLWIYENHKCELRFLRSESQNGPILNMKFANINFLRDRKHSRTEKFGHFLSTEKLYFFH